MCCCAEAVWNEQDRNRRKTIPAPELFDQDRVIVPAYELKAEPLPAVPKPFSLTLTSLRYVLDPGCIAAAPPSATSVAFTLLCSHCALAPTCHRHCALAPTVHPLHCCSYEHSLHCCSYEHSLHRCSGRHCGFFYYLCTLLTASIAGLVVAEFWAGYLVMEFFRRPSAKLVTKAVITGAPKLLSFFIMGFIIILFWISIGWHLFQEEIDKVNPHKNLMS